jgi:hypothetical protein
VWITAVHLSPAFRFDKDFSLALVFFDAEHGALCCFRPADHMHCPRRRFYDR